MSHLLDNVQEYITNLENTIAEQRKEIESLRSKTEPAPIISNTIEIYTDGSSLGNPGPGGAAWVTSAFDSGNIYVGDNVTNNQCEYAAVLEAVKFADANGMKNVRLFSDSNLVVQQLLKIRLVYIL